MTLTPDHATEEAEDPPSQMVFLDVPELEHAMRRPFPLRKRLVQLAWGALAALLVIIFVVRPGLLPGFGFANHPAPPVYVAVNSTVNYGTLTINGRHMPYVSGTFISLQRGQNSITLDAPPFHPYTCMLHEPPLHGDTCQSATIVGAPNGIFLPVSLSDLPAALHQSAVQTINAELQSTQAQLQATIQPGEWYPDLLNVDAPTSVAKYTIQQAHQRLNITLVMPSALPGGCDGPDLNAACAPLDTDNGNTPMNAWGITIAGRVSWLITDAIGNLVNQTPAFSDLGAIPLLLHFDAAAGWQFIVDNRWLTNITAPLNFTLAQTIETTTCFDSVSKLQQIDDVQFVSSITLNHVSMQGCDISYETQPPQKQQGSGVTARVLVRFGVALAEDAATYQFYQRFPPALPMATPQELAEAGVK